MKKDEDPVSRKLLPKARMEAYRIGKQTGPNNFVLVDMATGREITSFKQPVHADRLVPMEVAELAEPMDEIRAITLEGQDGTVQRQALDGRVLVRLATEAAEDAFAHRHRKLGAATDPEARGVWVDLSRFTYSFDDA